MRMAKDFIFEDIVLFNGKNKYSYNRFYCYLWGKLREQERQEILVSTTRLANFCRDLNMFPIETTTAKKGENGKLSSS